MGYEIHITRKENWSDKDDIRSISSDEWKNILASDSDMRLDGSAEATTINGETIIVESDGLSVWTGYSGNGVNSNYAWFYYTSGCVVCKNPDDEIIGKMLDFAERLNAKVQGDEGEVYTRSPKNEIVNNQIETVKNGQTKSKRLWWKFW